MPRATRQTQLRKDMTHLQTARNTPWLRYSGGLAQQGADLFQEARPIVSDDVPNLGVIDNVIATGQYISEGDDLGMISDAGRGFRIDLGQAVDSLADDLEVAFDGL